MRGYSCVKFLFWKFVWNVWVILFVYLRGRGKLDDEVFKYIYFYLNLVKVWLILLVKKICLNVIFLFVFIYM